MLNKYSLLGAMYKLFEIFVHRRIGFILVVFDKKLQSLKPKNWLSEQSETSGDVCRDLMTVRDTF